MRLLFTSYFDIGGIGGVGVANDRSKTEKDRAADPHHGPGNSAASADVFVKNLTWEDPNRFREQQAEGHKRHPCDNDLVDMLGEFHGVDRSSSRHRGAGQVAAGGAPRLAESSCSSYGTTLFDVA